MFFIISCKPPAQKAPLVTKGNPPMEDTLTIRKSHSIALIAVTASSIKTFTEFNHTSPTATDLITRFYSKRGSAPVWFDSAGVSPRVHMLANLINHTVGSVVLDADSIQEFYHGLPASNDTNAAHQILEMELRLTASFFEFALQQWEGTDAKLLQKVEWFIPKKRIDYESELDSLVANPFQTLHSPLYRQYELLNDYLNKYRKLQQGWLPVASPPGNMRLGNNDAKLIAIKHNLFLSGDLGLKDTTDVFTAELGLAIQSYQRRFGLAATGLLDGAVIKQMNVPVAQRIEQILINLERCRWVPATLKGPYLIINIPEYKLHVYDGDRYLWNMNIVAGSATNKTVIFSGDLKYIVINPYWNVPSSIFEKELFPKIKQDPGFIGKQDMELVKTGEPATVLDPTSVDWSRVQHLNNYTLRQKPGIKNALGKYKFLFPNTYNIYLHDTPVKYLFDKPNRSFSHGCIRLSDPEKLTLFLLKYNPGWSLPALHNTLEEGKEKYLSLKHPVPVFIAYFTSWVDREGKLNFRNDVYGHDATMAKYIK